MIFGLGNETKFIFLAGLLKTISEIEFFHRLSSARGLLGTNRSYESRPGRSSESDQQIG